MNTPNSPLGPARRIGLGMYYVLTILTTATTTLALLVHFSGHQLSGVEAAARGTFIGAVASLLFVARPSDHLSWQLIRWAPLLAGLAGAQIFLVIS